MIAFIKTKSDVENQFGKQLTKGAVEIDAQMGELAGGYAGLLAFCAANGERRLTIGKEEATKLCTQLNALLAELQKQMKQADKQESTIRKEYQSANQAAVKAKERDMELKKQYEGLQIQLLQSKDMKPKNLQALQKRVFGADKDSKKAESEYKAAIEKQNKTRDVYYQQLGAVMAELEKFDRSRVDQMKRIMLDFVSLQETFSRALGEQLERLGKAVENVVVERDIQSFISKTKTGNKRPPFEAFEPVDNKIIKELALPKFPPDDGERKSSGSKVIGASIISTKAASSGGLTIPSSGESGSISSRGGSSTNLKASSSSSAAASGSSGGGGALTIEQLKALAAGTVASSSTSGGASSSTALKNNNMSSGNQLASSPSSSALNDKKSSTSSSAADTAVAKNTKNSTSDFNNNIMDSKKQMNSSSSSSSSILKKVTVLYDYDSQGPEEISMKTGDTVNVYDLGEGDGWWVGEVVNAGGNATTIGKRGLFPSNFTTDFDESAAAMSGGGGGNPSNNNNNNNASDPSNNKSSTTSGSCGQCIALFAYEPQDPQELPLVEGNLIEIHSMGDDGWWQGKIISGPANIGKEGLFPSNYCQLQQ